MPNQRFVTATDAKTDELSWGSLDWLCRPDIVAAEQLQLVHVRIPPGQGHAFHRHPEMEEIIYVLEGECEQWVEREQRIMGPGDVAHIPMNMVHCSYNVGDSTLRVLAILSPAKISGPAMVDVSQEEPWKSLRR
jgi:quercetin dioxygenase-like cupin family protein